MTKRRRTTYDEPSVFNAGTIVNVLAIPLLTGLITVVGFYYVTNYRLQQNSDDIKAETALREKTSTEFFKQMGALNDNVGKLNVNVATQATALEAIKDALRQRR